MSEIEAVVFDVGQVLVHWDMRCLLRKLYASEAEAQWAFDNVVSPDWHFRHDRGEDLDALLSARIAQFPDHEPAIRAYATRFLETIPGPVDGTAKLIERLVDSGIPLFAITNFADRFWDEFAPTRPETDHFRDVVVSGKVKLAKPDPAIFALAAQRFGHAPEAMLFVDDNAANVRAAAGLGWQTHQFTDAAALERELVARGLLSQ